MAEQSGDQSAHRHPGDLIRLVLGTTLLAGSIWYAHKGEVGTLETDVFRLVNHLPEAVSLPLRVVMEAGSYAAVIVAGGLALAARRRRLARDLVSGGTLAWLLARVVKTVVVRHRPTVLLEGVLVRGVEATGLGFPSGHVAVEAALVVGLMALGVQTGPAVAGVLTYRLLTFWLPIIPGFLAFRYLQHRQVL
jgi:membrane-associated phospholipid phosphatase